jgi:hypothetical protein
MDARDCSERENARDREHFRGVPVSKRIGMENRDGK